MSFDRKHYSKYLLVLIVLLCLYGIMIFFFGQTIIDRTGVIETVVSLAERISKIIPLGIILVIIIEGVNRKMLAAIEDFKEWRKSREAWIRKRMEEASEAVRKAAREEASEAVKKEASEAVKREASILRQALLRQVVAEFAEKQQKYQDDMKSWVDRRLAAERQGEPFNEPMPTLTIVADDPSD